jgi:uncharacterized coiled-coil protein SlyX
MRVRVPLGQFKRNLNTGENMRKYDLNQKLAQAERYIADRLAQIAALKQAVTQQQNRIAYLQSFLTGLMSRNIFKRLWVARKRVK